MPRFAPNPTIAGPKDPMFLGTAPVDTGASISIISPEVRSRIKPPEMDMPPLTRSGGASDWCETFLVRFRHCGMGADWIEVEAAQIRPASPGVDMILGCDVLRRLVLHWDGPAGVARPGWPGWGRISDGNRTMQTSDGARTCRFGLAIPTNCVV